MKQWLLNLAALPTWLLASVLLRIATKPSHPWRKQFYTLEAWEQGRTPVCKFYDFAGWLAILNLMLFIRVLWLI